MGKSRTTELPERRAGEPRARRSLGWLNGLGCGVLAAMAPAMAVLLAFLAAPGLLALVLDRTPGRPVARAVLLFGLAASVGPAHALWESGMTMSACIEKLADPLVFGTAWAAAAFGWLVGEVVPFAVGFGLDRKRRARLALLEQARARYAEEWGLSDPP